MSSSNGAMVQNTDTLANGVVRQATNANGEATELIPPVMSRSQIQEMNIHQRIAEIKKRCVSLPKSQQNAEEGWYYTGHDQVVESLRGLMAEFGVNVYQEPLEFTTNEVVGDLILNKVHFQYEVINADSPDDRFTRHNFGLSYGVDDKAFNKCSTISEKFFLLRLFNIATFDDPDAHVFATEHDSGTIQRNRGTGSKALHRQLLPHRELVQRIQSLAKPLGTPLYRGILKSVAGKWKPEEVRSAALLEKLLTHMEAAVRGLKRLEAAQAKAGPQAIAPILQSLNVPSLEKVNNLKTLHAIVSAMEAKAGIVPPPTAVDPGHHSVA